MRPYFEAAGIVLYHGKFEEVAPLLPDTSLDACVADPPYGTTACAWDVVIPFDVMWAQLQRLLKRQGATVLLGSQPFVGALVMSNPAWFKWEDIWRKSHATGHLNCRVMPLRQHENILVFGQGRITYNPQITKQQNHLVRKPTSYGASDCYGKYSDEVSRTLSESETYPRSVIDINSPNHGEKGLHPTQKPVALMEYLVKTYTNEQEAVLDFTAGSGSTLVAAYRTGRRATGIEREEKYCEIAARRIEKELAQGRLFEPNPTVEPSHQVTMTL